MKYEHLLSTGKIGGVTLLNRVVLPAMMVGMANFDGTPSEALISYLEERARNGVGLIITEACRINERNGSVAPRQLAMSSDRHIGPFAAMVERIHRHGAKVFCQLHHPGRQQLGLMVAAWSMSERLGRFWPGYWDIFFRMVPLGDMIAQKGLVPAVVAPSAVPCRNVKQKTRALSQGEIKGLVRQFVAAAARARRTGADGVELHGAHGYLIQQFLSPATNLRTDEYGGSLDNRMRFVLEIIAGIRNACGPDFPIIVRLSVDEYYRALGETGRGIELDMGVEIARRLEHAGVDALDISSATYETMSYWLEPMSFEPGWRKNLARSVKEAVKIPVIAANLIRSPEQAEEQIADGIQDFVSLGRPHLAEPAWTRKVLEGREGEIKRCICCLWCFESLWANGMKGIPLECAVNPRMGREHETQTPRKNGNGRVVAIVGAGPAGLMAAEILGLRNFRPVVFERNAFVGGQLQLGNKPPKKEKINWCFRDLHHAALKNGAEIRLNSEAGVDAIRALNPYAVIVATGGSAVRPSLEGAQLPHVCTFTEILDGSVKPKGGCVAVIGSGMTGLETAEKLAEDGNRILVVEMLDRIAPGAFQQNIDDVLSRLKPYHPEFLTDRKLVRIEPGRIILENTQGGQREERNADHVVMAVGVKSDNRLAQELQPFFTRIQTIGDAGKVGRIAHAIRAGFDAAWNLD